MLSNWAYILIGDNNTGKTSFQRYLVEALCQETYARLPRNIVKNITHPRAPKGLSTLFTANRSYQEKRGEYINPKNYIQNFFKDADICILSSHSHGSSLQDVQIMVEELKSRMYNVAGVFWSNDYGHESRAISALQWQERFWINNPIRQNEEAISNHLREQAYRFADMLISRSHNR
ncbi:hypothetical protein ISP17_03365 [Dyella ginsengisoli]|uniref:ATP-binding protein n=1 Tax=Dyella ginsengisoli TaxID=363848 RepID=A0ABW8JPE3_9GAMM